MSTIFDLEEERLRKEIITHGAKRVLVQLPEGLKPMALSIASIIKEAGALAIISADPCYGACDLALHEAEALSADIIIHYGHSETEYFIHNSNIPIIFIEAKAKIDVRNTVKKALCYLEPWERIGLTTTVQHIHALKEAKEVLEEAGKKVFVADRALEYPGQVLGCNYENAKFISDFVDAFLFLGGGRFHALGLFLATMKPTVAADPFEDEAFRVDEEAKRIIYRRWMEISEASKARKWGVIIGLKTGQLNMEAALKIKSEIENAGKEAILLAMREITPEMLSEFPAIEAYVNTACPRIVFHEVKKFPKPLLTVKEMYVALKKISWDNLLKSGFL